MRKRVIEIVNAKLFSFFVAFQNDSPIDINVTRKEDSFKTSITLDEKGKIGANFNLPALFIPKFNKTKITTLSTFIQFILINIITFVGCFISYEIVKRINWLRPLLGMKKYEVR